MRQPDRGTAWRRDDLVVRLAATVEFALDSAACLLPAGTAAFPPDEEGPEDPFLRRAKFLCETGLLLHLASRVPRPGPALRERLEALAALIAPHARDQETRLRMHLRPTMAAELGVAHLCLDSAGHPDPEFDEAYRTALTLTSIGPSERAPWKDLEAGWHRELGAALPALDLEAATRRTAYNQGQDVLFGSREAAYAVTHGLLYASGFGAHRPRLTRPESALHRDTDSLTARCLDADDFDLTAELLLTWPFLRGDWSPTGLFALQTLDIVVGDYGFLPSMTLQTRRCAGLSPAQEAAFFYRESYHTVYVWGLLVAAILRTGKPVANGPPPQPARDTCAARLLDLLPARTRTPRWLATLSDPSPGHLGALAPLLVDIGVHRAVADRDVAAARAVLRAARDAALPPSAMTAAADALLLRLASAGTPVRPR